MPDTHPWVNPGECPYRAGHPDPPSGRSIRNAPDDDWSPKVHHRTPPTLISPLELRFPNLTPPPSQCPQPSHTTLLFSRVDIATGLPQTFSSLLRDGNGEYSKRLPPGPGDATFRRGQHLSKSLLSGRCLSGAFCLACARGEIGETVHNNTMLLGRKPQLFGEVGIFPNQRCWRREGLVTVFCIVCHEGTSSLVPSFPESGSREILRSGYFLFSGDL